MDSISSLINLLKIQYIPATLTKASRNMVWAKSNSQAVIYTKENIEMGYRTDMVYSSVMASSSLRVSLRRESYMEM